VPLSPRKSTVASLFETVAIISKTSCMTLELPMIFAGRKRSLSFCCNCLFSSKSRCRSSWAIWRTFTAWAITEATIVKRRTSSSNEMPSENSRSALSAPMASVPSIIGTQMKEMSFLLRSLRAPVRFKNIGSCDMCGMTAGSPVSITLPVIPSPSLYTPRRR